MNWKKFWLAAAAVFVVFYGTDIIIHAGILSDKYRPLYDSGVLRSAESMADYAWIMIVTHLVFSFFFTFIFVRGREGKGIAEGIRYGIYIGFFWGYVSSFNNFVVYPIPYVLTWYWIILGFIQMILMGILTSLIYKPKTA